MNQNKKPKKEHSDEKHAEQKPKVDTKQVKVLEEKIAHYEKQLAEKDKQIEEQKVKASQYLNTASYYKNEAENCKKDFERFKERNKNIESDAKVKANEAVALKIIPIIDSFDQAISHLSPDIMKGFSMIYQSLLSTLNELGVVEVKCKGEEMNAELHNCINAEPTDDKNLDGKIANVYQKGYKFASTEKLIRSATVSVYKSK